MFLYELNAPHLLQPVLPLGAGRTISANHRRMPREGELKLI
jgi:hypothetical protein